MADRAVLHLGVLTDDEISQAVCDLALRKNLDMDPTQVKAEFQVSYRQVKIEGRVRLFATVVVFSVDPGVRRGEEGGGDG